MSKLPVEKQLDFLENHYPSQIVKVKKEITDVDLKTLVEEGEIVKVAEAKFTQEGEDIFKAELRLNRFGNEDSIVKDVQYSSLEEFFSHIYEQYKILNL